MKTVGYLGIPGSYSHTAAIKYFESVKDCKLVGCDSFTAIFEAITDSTVEFGVIPIENTLAGSIYENFDSLDNSSLHIVGECYLKIEHNFLIRKDAVEEYKKNPKAIRTVYSHPKAIEQCSQFLREHKWMKVEPAADTANAAKTVSSAPQSFSAAIASKESASLYDLAVVKHAIENNPENYTRFLVIAKDSAEDSFANKVSLSIYMPHKKGSLYRILGKLVEENCNLTKIESRPLIGKPFEYIFYFDFQYDASKHDVHQIIKTLKNVTAKVELLGVYRSGKI